MVGSETLMQERLASLYRQVKRPRAEERKEVFSVSTTLYFCLRYRVVKTPVNSQGMTGFPEHEGHGCYRVKQP